MIADAQSSRAWTVALVGLLLASTVLGELKVPGIGVGVQNVILPGSAIGILFLNREIVVPALRRHRQLLLVLTLLLVWTGIAAVASTEPALGLRLFVKAFTYALPFLAFLVVLDQPEQQRAFYLTVLAFLVLLALGGVVEAVFPKSAVFSLLRSPGSLEIQPRISSFMSWPNAFGVALVSGVVLTGALLARGWIGWRWAMVCQILLVVLVALSGSRNAWATLLVVLVLVALASLKVRALVPAVIFGVALLVFPVAAWQAGLRDRVPVIEALVPEGARTSTSIAPAWLSLELRGMLWQSAAGHFVQSPWFGIGPGVFSTKVAPGVIDRPGLNTHSLPLNLLVELGLPGLFLSGIALAVAVRSGYVAGGGIHPAGAALGALLVGQLIDCFLYDPTSVTLLLAYLAAIATRPAG